MNDWKPAHYPSVSPYLVSSAPEALIAFLEQVFDATLLRRFDRADGSLMHAEVRIDDSVVMIGGGATEHKASAVHLHVYVPDAHRVYARALDAGAQAVQTPARKHAGDDLRAGFRDADGNTWWVANQ